MHENDHQLLVLFTAGVPCVAGRGMDLNPELLSAIDRLCVGLVVQCMFQCRVHNLNHSCFLQTWLSGTCASPCFACACISDVRHLGAFYGGLYTVKTPH